MALEHDEVLRLLISGRVLLLAYIQAIVRDSHLAEDVLQEISVLAVRKCNEIVDESHFRAWIRRAARLESMNVLRRHQKLSTAMPEPVLEALEAHWDNFDDEWALDRVDALRHCVGKLTVNSQQLLRMRYHEGVSGVALADRLGKPVNTVYVALSRIHRTLADCVARRLAAQGGV
jgi:RNA polymerase sigma-70 factor (ECF subfamily)